MPSDQAKKRRIAFLVDGKCEPAILTKLDQRNHSFVFIKRDKNGCTVSHEAIGNECVEILKVSGRLYRACIIIVDKEDRKITSDAFESSLSDLIRQKYTGEFDLVSTDIMFENWILSDIKNVSEKNSDLLHAAENSADYEGQHGAGLLNSLWKIQHERYTTDKIGNSKKLFKSVRPEIAKGHSSTFERFLRILSKYDIKIY